MGEQGHSITLSSDTDEGNDEVGDRVLSRNGGSFAERRAARCGAGFTAPRINASRYRIFSPTASPAVRSPCLTIPSGISPTALLDSPIMLLNTQALLSPTTGTFPNQHMNDDNSMLIPVTSEEAYKDSSACSSFRVMSNGDHDSLPGSMSIENQDADVDCHTIESEQLSIEFELPAEFPIGIPAMNCPAIDSSKNPKFYTNGMCGDLHDCHFDIVSDPTSLLKESTHTEDNETDHPAEEDPKGSYLSGGLQRTSVDGYNWRKYGQKQVKGSEYPRSYYKCTYSNCLVKKKVERSHDGLVTEIIYKGAHNHEKPQAGSTLSLADASEMAESSRRGIKIESGPTWRNLQSGSPKDFKSISDRRADGVERTSPTSVVTELSDPFSSTHMKTVEFEPAGATDLSSTFASHDDEDRATQGSISTDNEVVGEESESKRRRTDGYFVETNLSSRAVREPRVVIQIESEVDILEDGYRWRKYGQKVVKGNPNPRSYYKCTSAGCLVRKHVERASNNLKCVLTTYEGRHNHEVPAARSSNQISSICDTTHPNNTQPVISQAAGVSKPETKVHFDRKPEFNNAYVRPGCLGNFSTDMKLGTSSIYPMKIPFMQTPISYGSFGLDPKYTATSHSSCITSIVPDFPISPPLNSNLSASGLNLSNGRALGLVPTLVGRSLLKDDDVGFVKPKQEEKGDKLCHVSMAALDDGNLSSLWSSPQVYQCSRGTSHFP